jgi:hypothetical protein
MNAKPLTIIRPLVEHRPDGTRVLHVLPVVVGRRA